MFDEYKFIKLHIASSKWLFFASFFSPEKKEGFLSVVLFVKLTLS